jgi:hypothetical protein
MSGEPANAKGDNMAQAPNDLPTLPDPNICRTHFMGIAFITQCLVDTPQRCAFAQHFGGVFYCHHPDRLKFDKEYKGELR